MRLANDLAALDDLGSEDGTPKRRRPSTDQSSMCSRCSIRAVLTHDMRQHHDPMPLEDRGHLSSLYGLAKILRDVGAGTHQQGRAAGLQPCPRPQSVQAIPIGQHRVALRQNNTPALGSRRGCCRVLLLRRHLVVGVLRQAACSAEVEAGRQAVAVLVVDQLPAKSAALVCGPAASMACAHVNKRRRDGAGRTPPTNQPTNRGGA